jgi:hypothetical protein
VRRRGLIVAVITLLLTGCGVARLAPEATRTAEKAATQEVQLATAGVRIATLEARPANPPPSQTQSVGVECPQPTLSGDGQRWTGSLSVPQGCIAIIDASEFNGVRDVVTTLGSGTHSVNLLSGKVVQVQQGQLCTTFAESVRAFESAAKKPPSRIDRPPLC